MKHYVIFCITICVFLSLVSYLSSPWANHQSWDLLSRKTKGHRLARKSGKLVTKSDLVNIMKNLQRGTIVNEIVNQDRMDPRLRRFLRAGKTLRQKVLQVVKDKDSNKTGTAVAVSLPMKSKTIIYNRIYKSGSASFLCKFSMTFLLPQHLMYCPQTCWGVLPTKIAST